jgi:plastocyanin
MKALTVAVAVAALLTACGGSSGSAQPSGSTKVTMTEFHFDPSTINASHGKVVFFLVNSGTVVGRSDLVSAGDTFVFTVDSLAAGTYYYYCDQTGHEAAGMHGTLTVT